MDINSFLFLQLFFGLITVITVALLINACGVGRKPTIIVLSLWLAFQGILTFNEFYYDTFSFPPRFALLLGPTIIIIVLLFLTKKGKNYIQNLNQTTLTYLHTIRIPVEFTLYWLCCMGLVPELMTFDGRNFDIISGITAPFIAYFGYTKGKISRTGLIIWNIICLGLLVNIVTHAILSVPSNFQQFAFDQPNVAILTFPFSWLACCVVPIVLFSHLVSLSLLFKNKSFNANKLLV